MTRKPDDGGQPQVDLDLTRRLDPKALDALDRTHRRGLGILGKVFGQKPHAATNIAGVAVVIPVVTLCAAAIWPPGNGVTLGDLGQILVPIATGALGFLFGQRGGENDPS